MKILLVSQSELHQIPTEKVMENLSSQGYTCASKTVHQLQNADYDNYDTLIGMEQTDLRDMYYICGGDFSEKIFLLTEFIDRQGIRDE